MPGGDDPAPARRVSAAGLPGQPGSAGLPGVTDLLARAVAGVGGAERPGQVAMARAVERAIGTGEHLAVQGGTGTGKSLAYLVPALRHALAAHATVVVSTATIALQRQLIDRDLPRLVQALAPVLGREPVFAILKGRRNYLCLQRLRGGVPDDPAGMLFDPAATSAVGRQVQRLHEWAEQTQTGDRDDLVPGVSEQAWRQVAVTARECVGAQRCTFAAGCFAEHARDAAGQADIVVTNHALLAIDALEDFDIFPEHDVVVIDEAHDLVDRVTSVASAEVTETAIAAAARRCGRMVPAGLAGRLAEAGDALARTFADVPGGRLDLLGEPLTSTLGVVRDAAAACARDLRGARGKDDTARGGEDEAGELAARRAALSALDEVAEAAGRILAVFGTGIADRAEVVWMDRPAEPGGPRPPALRVAPLAVGELLAQRLFSRRTVVLTSATLALGGSFEPLARQWGLAAPAAPGRSGAAPPAPAPAGPAPAGPAPSGPAPSGPAPSGPAPSGSATAGSASAEAVPAGSTASPLAWTGLDVGSPFDHPRNGILYVARHLPPPGRDGLPESYLNELCELITAAGGRTLGLFSSMRAARQAATELAGRISQPILCQGDDQTPQLIGQFAADEATCLFGTRSLWQGVDVPGPSLALVVIDRIPFPRPDDPLASARQRAVAARGGNGFMNVAATQAALLLAQGAGRLLRTMTDRGVVAVLDPRLATARYGDFLRASLPPFWPTTDPKVVRGALTRLAG